MAAADHDIRPECAANFATLHAAAQRDTEWRAEVNKKLEKLDQLPKILSSIEDLKKQHDSAASRIWDLWGKVAGTAALLAVILSMWLS